MKCELVHFWFICKITTFWIVAIFLHNICECVCSYPGQDMIWSQQIYLCDTNCSCEVGVNSIALKCKVGNQKYHMLVRVICIVSTELRLNIWALHKTKLSYGVITMRRSNKSFENVSEFNFVRTTLRIEMKFLLILREI